MAKRSIVVTSNHGSRNGRNGLTPKGRNPLKTQAASTDFVIENHGSVFLLRPLTDAARSWVEEHISQRESFQPMWPTVVIDHSCIDGVIHGLFQDGWKVVPREH